MREGSRRLTGVSQGSCLGELEVADCIVRSSLSSTPSSVGPHPTTARTDARDQPPTTVPTEARVAHHCELSTAISKLDSLSRV
jgi:hypothetical protein